MTRVPHAPAVLGRCLLVWSAATASALAVVGALLPHLAAASDALGRGELAEQPFPELLVWCCEAALVVCASWWWVTATLVVRDARAGRAGDRAWLPRPVARGLAAACGVVVLGSAGTPVHANGDGRPHATDAAADVLAGLPLPQRATTTTRVSLLLLRHVERDRAATSGQPLRHEHVVEVRPGDTLWSLARRTLPPDAPTADVARRWPAIHALNRAVIGPDPDLIRPGQRLRLPRP